MWGVLSVGQPFDSLLSWPSNPLYNPDKAILNRIHKSDQKGFVILVDTQQNVDCNEYFFWIEKDKKYYPEAKVEYYEDGKHKVFDAKKTGQVAFSGFPVYLINLTDTTIKLTHRKYSVPLIQEALDTDGRWKPIETLFKLPAGVVMTNYYGLTVLKPGEMIVSGIYNYRGQYKTMLRVKILINGKTYYSEPFQGSINYSQIRSTKTYKFN